MNHETDRQAVKPRVRVFHFCSWADGLEDAAAFLERLPALDVRQKSSDANDARLERMARLDCDWHGENARCFAEMRHPSLEFLPARVVGVNGMLEFVRLTSQRPADEAWWLIFMGQHPQALAGTWKRLGAVLRSKGVRILFYAFDEASRTMPCFDELAPYLDVLIHDEAPLPVRPGLRFAPGCRSVHRSWVANLLPFSVPFVDNPDSKIIFLGSQLGLTPHRQRQIDFLQNKFKDTFEAIHDHSLPVSERGRLNRWKVSLCPEGRKFSTPAMAATHTDRPFWSGCLGMVPVSENSAVGGRLEGLFRDKMIIRYRHGDLKALGQACERALETSLEERRRIYSYFNEEETIGHVVASQIADVSL